MAAERRVCPDCLREIPPEETHCLCRGPGTRKAGMPRVLVAPDVSALYGKWLLRGPLLIGENGFYLFVASIGRRPDLKRTAGAAAAGLYAGAVGGLALKAAENLENGALGRPPGLRPREDFEYLYQTSLPKAPEILRCDDCLELPRARIRGAELHGEDLLVLHAGDGELELSGDLGASGVPGFLKLRGYPVSQVRGSSRRRVLWALGVLLMLATVAADVFEFVSIGEWAGGRVNARLQAVSLAFESAPAERYHLYGQVYYKIRGKMVPEAEVSERDKRLYRLSHWRWVWIFLAMCVLSTAAFFAHLRWVAR